MRYGLGLLYKNDSNADIIHYEKAFFLSKIFTLGTNAIGFRKFSFAVKKISPNVDKATF